MVGWVFGVSGMGRIIPAVPDAVLRLLASS
jgi:hypothetical protein